MTAEGTAKDGEGGLRQEHGAWVCYPEAAGGVRRPKDESFCGGRVTSVRGGGVKAEGPYDVSSDVVAFMLDITIAESAYRGSEI